MRRDPNPFLEATARRRITALAEDIAVPPAHPGVTGGRDKDMSDVSGGSNSPGGPGDVDGAGGSGVEWVRRRRPVVVAGAIAAAAASVAVAVQVIGPGGEGPGTGVAPAAADACGFGEAADGVVGTGTLESGATWEVRAQGSPPNQSIFAEVDGESVGGFAHDARSWPGLVNDGSLTLQASVTDGAVLVFGEIPAGTTRLQVGLRGGTAVSVCPVAVPGTRGIVHHFAVALPPGAHPTQVGALDSTGRVLATGDLSQLLAASPSGGATGMTIDPGLVSLPLGGTPSQAPPEPEMEELVSGDAPDGRWSLAAGRDGDDMVLQLDPGRGDGGGVQGTPAQLLGVDSNWYLDEVPGGLIVWGPVVPEAASVAVTLTDGAEVETEALDTVSDLPLRAFATFLPEGDAPTAIEARTASGTTLTQAQGVGDALRLLRDDGNLDGVGVLVVPPP